MQTSSKKHERGQVLVLLVLGVVVLLGFTALAVDGSMIYADRRFFQSVADSSALAGGREAARLANENDIMSSTLNCNSSLVKTTIKNGVLNVAQTFAASNNVSIDQNLNNNNGVEMVCDQAHGLLKVRVVVTHETKTAFAHFVFVGDVKNTAEAVVEVSLGDSSSKVAAGGLGLLALNPSASGSVSMTGSGDIGVLGGVIYANSNHNTALSVTGSGTLVGQTISVVGGNELTGSGRISAIDVVSVGGNSKMSGSGFSTGKGINVNGNLSLTGSGSVQSKDIFVNGDLNLTGSSGVKATSTLVVNGTVKKTGSGTISPTPVKGGAAVPINPMSDPLAGIDFPVPPKPGGSCTTFTLSGSGSQTINPGLYCSITLTGSGNLHLTSGVYWISGTGGFSVSGSGSVTVDPGSTFYVDTGSFSMNGSGNFTAPQVMFYLGPQAKAFRLVGSGSLSVSGQTSGPYKGLTLYVDRTNIKGDQVSFTGSGSTSSMSGTFYVPTRPVVLTGSGSTTIFNAQVICDTAELTGSGDLTLVYNENLFYQTLSTGDIAISLVK